MESEKDLLLPVANRVTDKTVEDRIEKPIRTRIFTVEPMFLLYFIYLTSINLIAQQYIFQVISLKNNYSTSSNISICNNDNPSETLVKLQQKVQSQSSHTMLVLNVTTFVIVMFTVILFGAYSDERGRKFAFAAPILGSIIKCCIYIVVISLELNYWYLLFGSIMDGLFGSQLTFMMAGFAYIGDISSMGSRTLRITILECALGAAMTVSQLSSGYLIQAVGYLYPFIILLATNIINLIYIVCYLPETRPHTTSKANFFNTDHFKKVFKLYMDKDGTNRRWKLQLNFVILVILGSALAVTQEPMIYFLKGRPLCLNEVQVGMFSAANSMALQAGTLTAVKFLEPILGNIGFMIFASISGICSMSLLAFTRHIWTLALASLVGVFSGLTIPNIRAITSKLVRPNEHGALFAGIAAAEALSVIIGISSVDTIYAATLFILPGFIFLIVAGVQFIVTLLASLQLYLTRRECALKKYEELQ